MCLSQFKVSLKKHKKNLIFGGEIAHAYFNIQIIPKKKDKQIVLHKSQNVVELFQHTTPTKDDRFIWTKSSHFWGLSVVWPVSAGSQTKKKKKKNN